MKRRHCGCWCIVAWACVVWAAASTLAWAGEPIKVDQTVAMPKSEVGELHFKAGSLIFEEVVIRNAPNEEDIAKAKSDPGDNCHPKLAVGVSNTSDKKMSMKIIVRLEGEDGKVYMSCDRTDDVQPNAQDDHTNLCWLDSMKTIDWPKVTKVHIIASIAEAK